MKSMRSVSSMALLILIAATAAAQTPTSKTPSASSLPAPELTEVWSPIPPKVTPGQTDGEPPSDAVVLFDGHDLSKWKTEQGGAPKWSIENGDLVVKPHSGSIQTKENFSDCQLHIEWMPPAGLPKNQTGQERGNSGVYLQGLYEVQILDTHTNLTYANGQAGAVYKQFSPLVNAAKPAGTWQSYDIIFTAPRFASDGTLVSPAKLTVLQNNVLVQNDVRLKGATVFRGAPSYSPHGPGPLLLQEHGNSVRFRNIWLRRL